ncbi:MAG: hypothetical protein LBT89_08785 [Planctomycetaceae bacterium]|jgi:Holliday junction resolvase-like predicted endonuclease|nr:hypothetical protein [Planctomycetaceae bacterium]
MTDEERRQIIDETWKLVRENERGIRRLRRTLDRYAAEYKEHLLIYQKLLEDSARQEQRIREESAKQEQRIRKESAEQEQRLREESAEQEQRIRKESAKQEQRLREESARREQRIREEDEQRKKDLDERFREVSLEIGGIGHSNGAFAEEYFINSLKASMTFGGIKFDEIHPHISTLRNGVRDEFDIIMANRSVVALIEVKYRVKRDFLITLTTRKVENFRMLLPDYADRTIYLGIGSMSFTDDVIAAAKGLGVGILKQTGETIEYDTEKLTAY